MARGADAAQNEGRYAVTDVVEMTGISAYTIRYYDKCGFFPDLKRGKRGERRFSSQDVHQLRLVDALRRSGLSIDGIRYFVRLGRRDEPTRSDRLGILQTQTTALEYQIAEAEESLVLLRNEVAALKEVADGTDPAIDD